MVVKDFVILPSSIVLASSLLFGCVSLSGQGKAVTIADEDADMSACKDLGEVIASPPFVGPSDAKNTLRNEAGQSGADTIVITKYGAGTAKAQAYKCPNT